MMTAFVCAAPFSSTVTSNTLRSNIRQTAFTTPLLTRNPCRIPQHHTRRTLVTAPIAPNLFPTVTMVAEGEKAPTFTATDTDGNTVSLDDYKGSKLILYFSNTAGPGCTKQSCSFRDAEAQFSALDAKILAISAQETGAAAAFKQSNSLNFPVVPDKDARLQRMYGVPATLGLIPGRITYVIDREGVVRRVHNAQLAVSSHITVAKEALAKIP